MIIQTVLHKEVRAKRENKPIQLSLNLSSYGYTDSETNQNSGLSAQFRIFTRQTTGHKPVVTNGMILHSAKVGISSHWHRNFIVPTMCLTSCKKSKNRHPVFAPCLFLLASNHLPSQVFNNWRLYRFLLLPCLLICRKGE